MEKLLEKARQLASDQHYTKSLLLYKTLLNRSKTSPPSEKNETVFFEYALTFMKMELEDQGVTTYKCIQLFKEGIRLYPDSIQLKEKYAECREKLRDEDRIPDLPLVETFSNIYPESLVKFIQKECKKINKFAVALPDRKRATFWFDLNEKPRFALEEIVQQICNLDFPGDLKEKHGIVGCEWWSQVKQPGDDIVFHFDKDEGMATKNKIFKFPYIATVTYMTECGGPTMVFDHRTTERNDSYVPSQPRNGFISMPAIGKHITFDGELFHGVMGAMNYVTKEPSRITFLINYWQYKPVEPNCVEFPYPGKMNIFTDEQRQALIQHVQNVKKDEIHPLPRGKPEHILPIIRGSQSFFISFPKSIDRDKTYSFETSHEIPSGFVSVKNSTNRELAIRLDHFKYSEDWYWTITVDKKNPIVMKSTENERKIKCKRGKHKIMIKAFTMKNIEIAHQMKKITV